MAALVPLPTEVKGKVFSVKGNKFLFPASFLPRSGRLQSGVFARGRTCRKAAMVWTPSTASKIEATSSILWRGSQIMENLMVDKRSVACRSLLPRESSALFDDQMQFFEAAEKGNLVPLFRSILSDQLTPVLAYRCLVNEDDRDCPSFLFEAIEQGQSSHYEGRFSSLGARPAIEIIAKENKVTVLNHEESSREEKIVDDPMDEPSRISSQWKPVLLDGLPDNFCGGWVGYFSYDTMRYVEKKKLPFDTAPQDDRGLPDIHLGLYKDVVVFDHVSKLVYAIHWVQVDQFGTLEQAYDDGMFKLDQLVDRMQAQRY